MKASCKDCPDRTVECHAHCEKYQAFADDRAKQLKARSIEVQADDLSAQRQLRVRKARQGWGKYKA